MTSERMRELLAPYVREPLADATIDQLVNYLALLLRWNARINLTAVREPEEMVTRHFGESLALAEWLKVQGTRDKGEGIREGAGRARLFDLGSGAGFPGAMIALRCPGMEVTLIEAQSKKAVFLKEVIRSLAIANCKVYTGRGESLEARADFVTMRAVDKSGAMLRVARGLLHPGGRLLLMGSRAQIQEVEASGWFAEVEGVQAMAGVHIIMAQRL